MLLPALFEEMPLEGMPKQAAKDVRKEKEVRTKRKELLSDVPKMLSGLEMSLPALQEEMLFEGVQNEIQSAMREASMYSPRKMLQEV